MKKHSFTLIIIAIMILGRIIPHPWNMTPTLALGLFCTRLWPRWQALALTLSTFLCSDIILAFTESHPIWGSWSLFSYSGILIVMFVASYFSSSDFKNNLLFLLSASGAYWLWTNFGCWLTMPYPKTLTGLLSCYTMALPFLKNEALGNILWFCIPFYATRKFAHHLIQTARS